MTHQDEEEQVAQLITKNITNEFKSIKEELHRLEDALKEEELNLNAFMNFDVSTLIHTNHKLF